MKLWTCTGWEAIDCSDERADDGGGKAAVLDGNLSTYWHSQWGPGRTITSLDFNRYEEGFMKLVSRNRPSP